MATLSRTRHGDNTDEVMIILSLIFVRHLLFHVAVSKPVFVSAEVEFPAHFLLVSGQHQCFLSTHANTFVLLALHWLLIFVSSSFFFFFFFKHMSTLMPFVALLRDYPPRHADIINARVCLSVTSPCYPFYLR